MFFRINYQNYNIEILKENKVSLKILRDNINHLTNKPGSMFLEWRYKNYKK